MKTNNLKVIRNLSRSAQLEVAQLRLKAFIESQGGSYEEELRKAEQMRINNEVPGDEEDLSFRDFVRMLFFLDLK